MGVLNWDVWRGRVGEEEGEGKRGSFSREGKGEATPDEFHCPCHSPWPVCGPVVQLSFFMGKEAIDIYSIVLTSFPGAQQTHGGAGWSS